MKELLKKFINKHSGFTSPLVDEVVDFKMKTEDDNNGFIGEHYIVTCKLINKKTKDCLVNKKIFEAYQKPSVKWL